MISLRRTRAVARKELLHIGRDPRSLYMALAIPMLLLALFGYALSLDVDRIPTLIYDQDKTHESRALAARFAASRFFEVRSEVNAYHPIELALKRGEAMAGLIIPAGFGRRLLAGKQAQVQFLLDGGDSNTAGIALGYARALVAAYSEQIRTQWQIRTGAGEIKAPVDAQLRVMFNSELRSRNYIVPGLIAVILMIIAALLTSLAIAREWENGTMEELLSTPLRPAELVLGKLSAFFLIGLADMLLAVVAGIGIFGVPLRGSALLLFAGGCIFLFGALCWGLFLSAVARNQLLAYQMGLLTSFLPAFLLSGFVYAIDNMPLVPRLLSYIVPARYFVSLSSGVFLKGVGLEILWAQLAFLVAYAALVFVLVTRKLREKLA